MNVPRRRAELDLLLLAAGTALDSGQVERLDELLESEPDWPFLVRAAEWHRTLPLLFRHLESYRPQSLPAELREDLRNRLREQAKKNLSLTGELLDLLQDLDARGVQAVPYKGAVVGASYYGNLALRPFGDIDLFIRRKDYERAKETLVARGYKPRNRLSRRQEDAAIRLRRVLDFSHPESGSCVELHWSIVPEYFSSRYEGADLWQRLVPMKLGGRELRVFSREDHLLVLCLHGAKHLWSRLIWICDIAEILRTRPDLGAVLDRARAIACERMVLLGIYLAGELLGAAVPSDVLARIESDPAVKRLAEKVYDLFDNGGMVQPGGWESNQFFVGVRRCLHEKLAGLLRVALLPNPEDLEWLSLPYPLWPAYTLTRPIRLLQRYGFRRTG